MLRKGGIIKSSDCFHLSKQLLKRKMNKLQAASHCVFLNLIITTGSGGALHSHRRPSEWDITSVWEEPLSFLHLFEIRGESRWCLIWLVAGCLETAIHFLPGKHFIFTSDGKVWKVVLETSSGVRGRTSNLVFFNPEPSDWIYMSATTITGKINLYRTCTKLWNIKQLIYYIQLPPSFSTELPLLHGLINKRYCYGRGPSYRLKC